MHGAGVVTRWDAAGVLVGARLRRWKLTVVDADGSDPIVVASGDASVARISGSWEPAWSPDGSRLAFTA